MAIKTLPSKEHTFTIDEKGAGTTQQYQGTFTYKKPSIRVSSDIAKTKALLDGGLELDEQTDFIHEVLATLRHTLVNYPQWWIDDDYGFELDRSDVNILLALYKECDEFEKSWFEQVWTPETKESEQAEQKESKA